MIVQTMLMLSLEGRHFPENLEIPFLIFINHIYAIIDYAVHVNSIPKAPWSTS